MSAEGLSSIFGREILIRRLRFDLGKNRVATVVHSNSDAVEAINSDEKLTD